MPLRERQRVIKKRGIKPIAWGSMLEFDFEAPL